MIPLTKRTLIGGGNNMTYSDTLKRLVLAMLLTAGCAGAAAADAEQAAAEPNKQSIFSDGKSLYDKPQDSETSEDLLTGALLRVIAAIVVVVVLGIAALYGSRTILPKLSSAQGKQIRIVETVHLGSRKTLHLVEIRDQQILIGSTSDRISKLADIFSDKGFPLTSTPSSEAGE